MAAKNVVPAIGIDLGTTFSVAAVHRRNKTEIIPDKSGKHLIPSTVFYHPDNLGIHVGQAAESQLDITDNNHQNVLYDIKRIIGRKFEDAYVQELITFKRYPFQIVRGPDGRAAVELRYNGAKVTKYPEEISAEILKNLRDNANRRLGVDVSEAVISVPARFSNSQRKATRTAAEMAGFRVLRLISEPVAAAIHYTEDMQPNGIILVVDLGGGTLDISIVEVKNKKFCVKSVEGNTVFGGRDFDNVLCNHVKSELKNKYKITKFSDRILHRINKQVIKTKCKLSEIEHYAINLPLTKKGKFGNKIVDCLIPISRTKFEELIKELISDFLALLDRCVTEAGLSKDDISDIVLVGGSMRIPRLQEAVRNFFNKDLKVLLNPDEAIALGAAVQAAALKNDLEDFEEFEVTEVTPLFLGIALRFQMFCVIIPKNSSLPFRSKPFSASTTSNNQTRVNLNIYEGHRKNCECNNLLGTLRVENLPQRKAADVTVEVTFYIDGDGILEIEAWETTSLVRNKLMVNMGVFGLCDYKERYTRELALANRREDDIFHVVTQYKSKTETMYNRIIYEVEKKPYYVGKSLVLEKCKEMLSIIKTPGVDIRKLREKYVQNHQILRALLSKANINVGLPSDEEIFNSIEEEILRYNAIFYGSQRKERLFTQ